MKNPLMHWRREKERQKAVFAAIGAVGEKVDKLLALYGSPSVAASSAKAKRDPLPEEPQAILNQPEQTYRVSARELKDRRSDFELPNGFVSFPVVADGETQFLMVVDSENRSSYDQMFYEYRTLSELGRLFVHLLRGEGIFVDLGANIGTVCLPVAASGSRVIAVEMLPTNVLKLGLAVLINGFSQMRVVQAAVTDNETVVGYSGESAWGQVSEAPTLRQAVGLRLDTIIDQIVLESPQFLRAPVAMKIDIEGHELPALVGADRFLQQQRPIFVFESIQNACDLPGRPQDVKRMVCDLGYSLHMIRGSVLSPHSPDDYQISLVSDILAIPQELGKFVADRLSEYQMRHLSPAEQVAWLVETAPHTEAHRRHAAAVIPRMKEKLRSHTDELNQLAASL